MHNVTRLYLIAIMNFWRNSTLFFGTTKIGDFRRRPSRSLLTFVFYQVKMTTSCVVIFINNYYDAKHSMVIFPRLQSCNMFGVFTFTFRMMQGFISLLYKERC